MNASSPASVDLDLVAAVLTPDVIVPYEVPVRTIPLGTRESFGIRGGYLSREFASGASRVGAPAPAPASVQVIVQRLAHTFGADRVHTSVDTLGAHPAPDVLVREMAHEIDANALLVIATPVRAFAAAFDHPGPPDDASRLREWTFPELHAFLDGEGLDVVFGGIAAAAAGERCGETAVLIAAGRVPSRDGRLP